MTVLAALLALVAPAPAQAAPPPAPHWTTVEGCRHGHQYRVARRALTRLLKNHRPMTDTRRRAAAHLRSCTMERGDRDALESTTRRLRKWRRLYAHRWPIKFNSLPAAWQNWAYATGACETGNNPATSTGNGFHGAFQFLLSTWWAAGGQGYPEQHSWAYQAWIAVHWRMRSSQSQWPNCAPW